MNMNLVKKRKRNFWALMLALSIVISMMPFTMENVFAASPKTHGAVNGCYEFTYSFGDWICAYMEGYSSALHTISVGDTIQSISYYAGGAASYSLYVDKAVVAGGTNCTGLVVKIDSNKMYLCTDHHTSGPGSTNGICDRCGYNTFATENGSSGNGNKNEKLYVDGDTFKSELPPHSILVMDSVDAKTYKDMKAHSFDKTTAANQQLLASYYAKQIGKEANIVINYGVYIRSALSINENGAKKVLEWNNLSCKTPGPIFAVCYNEKDGAYLISGTVNEKGTAVFSDYILRDATNVTIFTVK